MTSAPILTRNANLLLSINNVNLSALTGSHQAMVASSMKLVGNWVGGKFFLFDQRIEFHINSMNKVFQNDTHPSILPIESITHVSIGKMLIIAPTLDIECDGLKYRFRMFGVRKAYAKLNAMLDVNKWQRS